VNGLELVSDRYPYLPVFLPVFLNVHGLALEIEALVDTGFGGGVMVPAGTLQQRPDGIGRGLTADGNVVRAPSFHGRIQLGHFPAFNGEIVAMGELPLVGREVLDRFLITLDHGHRLTVRR
jgi:predicted aspartyl protease